MIRKAYIVTFVLFALTASSAFAQSSAQATMRVSVNIVSGSSVTVEQPAVQSFSEGMPITLGKLFVSGASEGMFIHQSEKVSLSNHFGEEVTMDVINKMEHSSDNIRYEGIAESGGISGVYKGTLTTTIEYL